MSKSYTTYDRSLTWNVERGCRDVQTGDIFEAVVVARSPPTTLLCPHENLFFTRSLFHGHLGMQTSMEQLFTTVLVPMVVVLAPIAYLVLFNRQKVFGESLLRCLEGRTHRRQVSRLGVVSHVKLCPIEYI